MLQFFIVEQISLTILEWNNLDINIGKANSLMPFKNSLLRVGRPTAMPTYSIHNPIGLKFPTRLRLALSHFNEHKLKHDFSISFILKFERFNDSLL